MCFVFDFVLHTTYNVDACEFTRILPLVSSLDDGGHKSDADVGSGSRRRFLDSYGFCFSTTLRNVLLIELRDSVVFSIVQMIMKFERIG
jgi:hypothetical protein